MEKQNRTWLIFVLIIILFVLAILTFNLTGKIISESKGEITIGAVMPLSGVSSFYGTQNQMGMNLALKDINSRGGINGRNLKIQYEDSLSKVGDAVTAINKLINTDNYKIILTSAASPETLAEAPVAEKNKVILLAAGSAVTGLRDAGDYIFRIKLGVDNEMEVLINFAYKNLTAKTAEILYVENDYGEGVRKIAVEEFAKYNITVLGQEGFKLEEMDFRTYLDKVKRDNPDVVVLAGWPRNLGMILKQARELNIEKKFIAPGGTIGHEILSIAGSAADNLIFVTEFNLESEREETSIFRQKFNKTYNQEPELFAAMGYDAVKIIAKVLEKCSSDDANCVKDELYKTQNYPGVSAILSFDDHGDVFKSLIFKTIKNGKFVDYS